ncbi:rhodanese-like domain-containing protein [Sporolactobacillus pectinivorans]|uniref:rhodanese-like domain-containing protein n=1 Tax=Sporolactobacillus pectinivorans TaxID=1591408 RepID=UPI000C26B0E8|nr:rhodanese-like domain-containing protein [Sporolactobacillus pectinivorans]
MLGWIFFIVLLAAYLGYTFASRYFLRKYLTTLSEADFRAGYRKAQLIDVREANEFKSGHILGARNIPLEQIKMRKTEIRHDMPIYLYCSNGSRSSRAASVLKKLGYKNLFDLQGGFKKWDGRVKSSN